MNFSMLMITLHRELWQANEELVKTSGPTGEPPGTCEPILWVLVWQIPVWILTFEGFGYILASEDGLWSDGGRFDSCRSAGGSDGGSSSSDRARNLDLLEWSRR